MNEYLRIWTPQDVQNARTKAEKMTVFARYAHQKVGTPLPTVKDRVVANRHVNDFFKLNPTADWVSLCRVVDFAKARRIRCRTLNGLIGLYRQAWAAGYMPELDPTEVRVDEDVEAEVERALQVETRPGWRRRFLLTTDLERRKGLITEWKQERASSSSR